MNRYYDPLGDEWLNDDELADRVADYQIAREQVADELQTYVDEWVDVQGTAADFGLREQIDSLRQELQGYDDTLEVLEYEAEAQAPPELKGELADYFDEAMSLVKLWGFDPDDESGEWEWGHDYEGESD